ncbi:hypothetical protein HY489_02425 [Candidatus Woesearchaeota archaeon]|nr:hypothetical protein [Candidatus Woesearchaeota archaeon]
MKAIHAIIAAMLVFATIVSAAAAEVPIDIDEVEIDDTVLDSDNENRLSLERGEEYEVRVRLTPYADVDNLEIRVFIAGYEFSDTEDIEDTTPLFDAEENVTYVKKLKIRIPDEVERDNYKLRVVFSDRFNQALVEEFNLKIDVPRNAVRIDDVVFNPSNAVRAGSALLAKVRIENKGEKTQQDVRVTVSIPGLGISGTQYIEEIDDEDEEEETEEIFLRIPKCAKPGTYDALVEVEFLNRHKKVSERKTITVLEDDTCVENKQQTSITLGNQLQNAQPGQTVVYPVTITNAGRTSKTFTITVPSTDWASVTITPTSTMVMPAGQTQTAFVNVQVGEEALTGAHSIVATVASKDSTQQLTLTTNVQAAPTSASDVLEVVLVILVALLVVLGVVIGVAHLRGKEQTENYY